MSSSLGKVGAYGKCNSIGKKTPQCFSQPRYDNTSHKVVSRRIGPSKQGAQVVREHAPLLMLARVG